MTCARAFFRIPKLLDIIVEFSLNLWAQIEFKQHNNDGFFAQDSFFLLHAISLV